MNIKHALVSKDDSIREAVQIIDSAASRGGEPGIAVVVDEDNKVLGVVTDGDIRDAFCRNLDFSKPVHSIMSMDYVYVYNDITPSQQLRLVLQRIDKVKKIKDPRLSKVIVCTKNKEFVDIVNLFELYRYGDVSLRRIAVYGMGFVGLTIALTFAELQEFAIIGVDIDKELIEKLKKGITPFYEKGLDFLLKYCHSNNSIQFKHAGESVDADIHIISVGTPIDEQQKPDYSFLESSGNYIGKILKEGDLVICRSTVPAGTTRHLLIPLLEKASGLTPGKDFFISFAPERTLEGNALKELKSLPQIVGGYSRTCTELTAKLFQKITPSIIQVNSLEAAEIIKLVNNTYRDTVFSFANEVALMCDMYNLDAFEIIEAANKGYPRSLIPVPSPGVGGICLFKDPYLYSFHGNSDNSFEVKFGHVSRAINQKMPGYVFSQFKKFVDLYSLNPETTKVLIVGLAFKGHPETSDTRCSPSIDLSNFLKGNGYFVQGVDHVLSNDEIYQLGICPTSIEEGIKKSNAVFFMNNHPLNMKFDLYNCLMECKKPFFLFDGWNLFNKIEIESIDGIIYGTMGYSSVNKS